MKRSSNIMNKRRRSSEWFLTIVLIYLSVIICGLAGCTYDEEDIETEQTTALSTTTTATTDTTTTTEMTTETTQTTEPSYVQESTWSYMDADRAMELINELRVEYGLPKLNKDEGLLQSIAELRLFEIKSVFDHTRPNGSRYITAFNEYGLHYTAACENLARGQMTAEQVVQDWASSQTHLSNILNPNITDFCVVCGEGYYDGYPYVYWVYLAYAQ